MRYLGQLALCILHQIQPDAATARHFAHQQILQLSVIAIQHNFHRTQQPFVKTGGEQGLITVQPALPLLRLLLRPDFTEVDKVLRGQRG
ncbi:hypothetical protein D3C80_1933440 [compost metagenome]